MCSIHKTLKNSTTTLVCKLTEEPDWPRNIYLHIYIFVFFINHLHPETSVQAENYFGLFCASCTDKYKPHVQREPTKKHISMTTVTRRYDWRSKPEDECCISDQFFTIEVQLLFGSRQIRKCWVELRYSRLTEIERVNVQWRQLWRDITEVQ